jgi:hypothetical protein
MTARTDFRSPASCKTELRILNYTSGHVSEEILNSASQPAQELAAQAERLPLLSRFSFFLSDVLDRFSFLFFCLPFSSLTHLLSSWCSRFIAEE